jgi:regulator of protease activity HflC (stomatin/prohibitin superfamily)
LTVVGFLILCGLVLGYWSYHAVSHTNILQGVFAVVLATFWFAMWIGLFTIQPNEAAVLMLFGKYKGTATESGLRWANPFYTKTKISQRARNINGTPIKVNDLRGNPIEIAAVVVWHVEDTARAVFDVDRYEQYVTVQIESALRHLAMAYPYDVFEGDTLSLRGSTDEVSASLRKEIQERVAKAGVIIDEARLSHLAYAQEIAAVMLQRQQAEAVVAARSRIVEGAVGMVEMALERLKQTKTIELDEERKAAMVSNLMVVLCGHEPARPVINAGTMYT